MNKIDLFLEAKLIIPYNLLFKGKNLITLKNNCTLYIKKYLIVGEIAE